MKITSEVDLEKVILEYSQAPDSCSKDDMSQTLTIGTEDAGGGQYLVLKTERWAIDDIKGLVTILEDFMVRSGITGEKQKEAELHPLELEGKLNDVL